MTIEKGKAWVNAACLKAFPNVWYVLFLLDRVDRKIMLLPADEDEQHVVRWKTPKKKSRKLSCDDFLLDVAELMNWDLDSRRKLYGRTARDEDSQYLVFDLNAPHTITLEEHRQRPLVKRLEENIIATD